MNLKSTLMDKEALRRTISRISHEIIEKNENLEDVVLIGVKTRGVPIAKRIAENVEKFYGDKLQCGTLDITNFRDDISKDKKTSDKSLCIDCDIENKTVIIVDDVLFAGRTARASIDAILSHARPAKIQLAVIVDRGHRELPIRPDYVGKNVPSSKSEIIKVSIKEIDGDDKVEIYE
ncbi:MAG: bifunctional pyr operon transcriptional regulator/uracil phosphoribosyltransferase PyrR [Bacillota bacterium]